MVDERELLVEFVGVKTYNFSFRNTNELNKFIWWRKQQTIQLNNSFHQPNKKKENFHFYLIDSIHCFIEWMRLNKNVL